MKYGLVKVVDEVKRGHRFIYIFTIFPRTDLNDQNILIMPILHQRFEITYNYPVVFTDHLFDPGNNTLADIIKKFSSQRKLTKILTVVDNGLFEHYPQLEVRIINKLRALEGMEPINPVLGIPGGERAKNESTYLEEIIRAINDYKVDRHSFVMAVGGGSVLDLAGYASAVSHRGVQHIRVPTTVLSQNDSGVGVKNGINYFGKKNFLGTFSPPAAVFNDSHFLATLNDRDWRSGIAEAVKVSLIKDRPFYEWIERHIEQLNHRDMLTMKELVYRCAQLHLDHIASGDPFESGSSRPLDFGHWSAHKLEQISGFELRHGEAVAIGMAIDVLYSVSIGWLDEKSAVRILKTLKELKFSLFNPALEDEMLLEGIQEFREHLGGELTIMLLKGIGKGANIHEMDPVLIAAAINRLKQEQLTLDKSET